MYTVFITNNNITSTLSSSEMFFDTSRILDAKISDSKNAIPSFSFTIYPNHPFFSSLYEFKTLIQCYNESRQRYDFEGRVLKVSPEMSESGIVCKKVVCEGMLGVTCDSVQPYVEETMYSGDGTKNGLQEFIDLVLSNHNSQVEDWKRIYRGNVSLITYESSEGVYKALNHETTYDILKTKLLDVFGGEMVIRRTNNVLYLDYAEELGTTRATTIELGKNMTSASREFDPSSIITRLIPLGAKLTSTDEEGNETQTEERLQITDIYVQDDIAYSNYGAIYGTVTWDDVTTEANLISKATNWLAENNTIKVSNKITAVDLSMIGLDIDDFKLLDKYPVKNSLINLNDTLKIIKVTIDINEPSKSSFEMGDSQILMSDTLVDTDSILAKVDDAVNNIESQVMHETQVIYDYVTENMSVLNQSQTDILMEVSRNTVAKSDFETLSETVKNTLDIDADGTTMIFTNIYEEIQKVGDVQSSAASTLSRYIRFSEGNILLGEERNPLTLTLENDKIAFRKNGVVVSYWDMATNMFMVGNIHVLVEEKAQFGNYAFVPRSNGSLDFLKVGG